MSEDRQELAKVARWIAAQLASGRSNEEITAALIQQGIPEEQAGVWVTRMAAGMADGRVAVPAGGGGAGGGLAGIFGSLGGRVGGVIGVILMYGVLNGALYVGQDFLARDDVARAEALEARLGGLGLEIDSIAAWLEGMERESATIASMGQQGGRGSYQEYNARVDRWNNVTLPAINRLAARHDSLIDVHNGLVDEYNAVARTAYSRWWLIPVPMPGGRARGSHSLDP